MTRRKGDAKPGYSGAVSGETGGGKGAGPQCFRPCIDIRQGKVTQIVGATLRDKGASKGASKTGSTEAEANFVSERPASFFASLYKQHGLKGGHVIMLDRDQATKEAALAALRAFPGGLQVGGGVNPGNAMQFLEAGASHVIVTSYVFENG